LIFIAQPHHHFAHRNGGPLLAFFATKPGDLQKIVSFQ